MSFASLDRLKRYIGKDDSEEDALLENVLRSVESRMEREMQTPVSARSVKLEPHYAPMSYPSIVLNWGPVKEVNLVTEAGTDLELADATGLASSDWRMDRLDNRSIVRLDSSGYPRRWYGQVIVTYKAGFEQVPESITQAAVTQAAFEYKQTKPGGNRLGLASLSPESGDGVTYSDLGWLPVVEQAMAPFRANL